MEIRRNIIGYILISYLLNILLYHTQIINNKFVLYLITIITLINSLFYSYSKKEMLLLIIFFLDSFISKDFKLFILILIAINMKEIDSVKIENYIKKYFYIGCTIFCSIVFLARINIIDTKYFIYSATVIRNGLGFSNPNTIGIYYFFIVSHYYFYKWEKLKFYNLFFVLLGYIYRYIYAISRTNLIIGIFQTVTILILRKKMIYKKFNKIFYLFPSCFYFLSIFITFFYTEKLNKFMTYRPITWKLNLIDNYNNITNFIFGSLGNEANYSLDNGFLSIQYYFGIIMLVMIIILLTKGLKNIEKKYKPRTYILFISYLVYALSEDMLFSPNFGIITLYILSRSFNKKGRRDNGK